MPRNPVVEWSRCHLPSYLRWRLYSQKATATARQCWKNTGVLCVNETKAPMMAPKLQVAA